MNAVKVMTRQRKQAPCPALCVHIVMAPDAAARTPRRSSPDQMTQAGGIDHVEDTPSSANEPALTQIAQHA